MSHGATKNLGAGKKDFSSWEFVSDETRELLKRRKLTHMRKYDLSYVGRIFFETDLKALTKLKNIIEDIGCGAFIAGSSITLSLINIFDECGDIDIFVDSESTFERAITILTSGGYSVDTDLYNLYLKDPKAVAVLNFSPSSHPYYGINKKIQLVKTKCYANAFDLISEFDLTVCKFAMTLEFDKVKIITTKCSEGDLLDRYIFIDQTISIQNTFERIKKYQDRGFKIFGVENNSFLEQDNDFFQKKSTEVKQTANISTNNKKFSNHKNFDLWSDEQYRRDYCELDPRQFREKYGKY